MTGNPQHDAVLYGLAIPAALAVMWLVPFMATRRWGQKEFLTAMVAGMLARFVVMGVAVVAVALLLDPPLKPFIAALCVGTALLIAAEVIITLRQAGSARAQSLAGQEESRVGSA